MQGAPSRLAALSNRALFLASLSPTFDTRHLSRWLYRYGTLPRCPAIERDFGPEDSPMFVLGLNSGASTRTVLEARYETLTQQGWFSFAHSATPMKGYAECKLYVSPRPEALATAFPVVARTFAAMEVRAFKVGRGIEGLLRPDKLVAYFDTWEHMRAVATVLGRSLAGCHVHGVPFTAGIAGDDGADGLLSWGIDPPDVAAGPVSWRSWVTERLAAHLVAARPATGAMAISAALRGIAQTGVDPLRWTVDRAVFAPGAP
jgi:hypothetical protein